MNDNTKKAISASIAVSGLATGAFLGFVIAIRLKYGVDAPFEDFMPLWMSKAAYWLNNIADTVARYIHISYFEDGSFIIKGCNPFSICN